MYTKIDVPVYKVTKNNTNNLILNICEFNNNNSNQMYFITRNLLVDSKTNIIWKNSETIM